MLLFIWDLVELYWLVVFERLSLNYFVRISYLNELTHSMLMLFAFKEECSSLLHFLSLEKLICLKFLVLYLCILQECVDLSYIFLTYSVWDAEF